MRRAVGGDVQAGRGGDRRGAQELADPAAPGHVDLQAVHVRDHPGEVRQVKSVLAGRHVGPDLVAYVAQAGQVVGGDRLLVPAHVQVLGRRQ